MFPESCGCVRDWCVVLEPIKADACPHFVSVLLQARIVLSCQIARLFGPLREEFASSTRDAGPRIRRISTNLAGARACLQLAKLALLQLVTISPVILNDMTRYA